MCLITCPKCQHGFPEITQQVKAATEEELNRLADECGLEPGDSAEVETEWIQCPACNAAYFQGEYSAMYTGAIDLIYSFYVTSKLP